MSVELRRLRAESEAFAAAHLQECADELVEWAETACLRDGKVRELARKCAIWAGGREGLKVAERLVQRAALDFVVASGRDVRLNPHGQSQREEEMDADAAQRSSRRLSCGM